MSFREYERIPIGAGDLEDADIARRALAEAGERYREERSRSR